MNFVNILQPFNWINSASDFEGASDILVLQFQVNLCRKKIWKIRGLSQLRPKNSRLDLINCQLNLGINSLTTLVASWKSSNSKLSIFYLLTSQLDLHRILNERCCQKCLKKSSLMSKDSIWCRAINKWEGNLDTIKSTNIDFLEFSLCVYSAEQIYCPLRKPWTRRNVLSGSSNLLTGLSTYYNLIWPRWSEAKLRFNLIWWK